MIEGAEGEEPTEVVSSSGITYDETAKYVTVNVIDPGDGKLVVESESYDTGEMAYFNNKYDGGTTEVSFDMLGSKTLVDEAGAAMAMTDGQFSFSVVDNATGQEVATGVSKADGSIDFGSIFYSYYTKADDSAAADDSASSDADASASSDADQSAGSER